MAEIAFITSRSARGFREHIPEMADAARYLDAAVSAHLSGRQGLAEELIRAADMPILRQWLDSIWGKNSPYVQPRLDSSSPNLVAPEGKTRARMPTKQDLSRLIARDGFHCRICGMPLVRAEVRKHLHAFYPEALPWGSTNSKQHAAFQVFWYQYDHLIPHARGGNSDIGNMIAACAACNYGRMQYTLDEVGLSLQDSPQSVGAWDGLERVLAVKDN